MENGQILLTISVLLATLLSQPGGDVVFDVQRAGHATYYLEADGTGNCMLEELPEPQMVGAMNTPDYTMPVIEGVTYPSATLCGAYAKVTGNKGSVVIKIVDRCPDAQCTRGHIDLSPEAFGAIDDPVKGYVPITWQLVSPSLEGPLRFRYKDGSSQWWTAIQVRNHRNPVARLEVMMNGVWRELPRRQYNYFVADDGLGRGYHTFRVTDVFGQQLIETSSVELGDYEPQPVDWMGHDQFPPPR